MKRCNWCQEIQKDENNFCMKCGRTEFSFVSENINERKEGYETKKVNGKVIGLIIAIAVVGILLIFMKKDPVEQVIKYIDAGDQQSLENAYRIYEEDILFNIENSEKFREELQHYMDDILEEYRKNDITFEYLNEKLSGIERLGVMDSERWHISAEAKAINSARESYQEAELEMQNQNYKEAMQLYESVLNTEFESREDAISKYESAKEHYKEEVIGEVKALISENKYEDAEIVITEGLSLLPEDADFIGLSEECTQAKSDFEIQNIVDQAQTFMQNKEFMEAITYLDESISVYPVKAIIETREDCLLQFETYIREESLKLAKAGEYERAKNLAQDGLSYFGSTEMEDLVEIYSSYIPVRLVDMEIFEDDSWSGGWDFGSIDKNDYLEDNYGNTYEHSMSADSGSIVYLLDYQYRTFKGVVAFPAGEKSDSYKMSATLQIFGDDDLIATFQDVAEDSRPESFVLDVSKYERLTLKWSSYGLTFTQDWGEFATIFDGVIVPVEKALPK